MQNWETETDPVKRDLAYSKLTHPFDQPYRLEYLDRTAMHLLLHRNKWWPVPLLLAVTMVLCFGVWSFRDKSGVESGDYTVGGFGLDK